MSGSAAHEEIAGAMDDELKLTSADVGYFVLCSASLEDNFGRVFNSVATTATPVVSGIRLLLSCPHGIVSCLEASPLLPRRGTPTLGDIKV